MSDIDLRAAERPSARAPDTVVIGAGAFGAWTARHLQRGGHKVLLVDAWGPANARAASGGESRLTRASYGGSLLYSRMAWQSLGEWRALAAGALLPLFHPTGVLFMVPGIDSYVQGTLDVHRALGLPTRLLDRAEIARLYPQIALDGIDAALWEPEFGALMARRAVQELVARFVAAGGEYRHAAIRPPPPGEGPLDCVIMADGGRLHADRFVFACGAWLPKLFPDLLGRRIRPTRQEVFFFAPAAGDRRFSPPSLPAWADFSQGYYGFPDLEARGVKVACDLRGPVVDPDTLDRTPTPADLADARRFLARRFPDLADAPLSEARVCQYENSASGNLLIDVHPQRPNLVLLGAGSGHGFKLAPAAGAYAAGLVGGTLREREPCFALAAMAEHGEAAFEAAAATGIALPSPMQEGE
jgi:glycine/D-amino acid oxidase-like deaminating enzyme